MKSVVKSSTSLRHLALAALLAAMGASAMAQATPAAPSAPMTKADRSERREGPMGRHDPAKMQAMMAKRQSELKARLNITPAQEAAWATYATAMQPTTGMHSRPGPEQRAEMDKLTTPQRIDKMGEMRTQHMTEMNARMSKRSDATKALYAALSPEQQKVFDTQAKHGRHGGKGDSSHQGRHG